jgi:flagellar assembly protein FliH
MLSRPETSFMKAYERWQFASLVDEGPTAQNRRRPASPFAQAAAPAEPEHPPGPSAAEVAANELAVLRETARADGQSAGFAAGFSEGRAEGLAAAAAEVEHLRRIAAAMAGALTDLQDETARALVDLAIGTARHVLREELTVRPEAVLGAVREAIDLAGAGGAAVLQLNSADIGFVQRHLGEEVAATGLRLAEDARIEPGGCRLSTTNGSIDALLKTRWERAMAGMGRKDAWDIDAGAPVAAVPRARRAADDEAAPAATESLGADTPARAAGDDQFPEL